MQKCGRGFLYPCLKFKRLRYDVELRKQNIPIRQTLDIYRSAVSCLIEIYAQTWDELAVITEPKKRFNTDLKELFSEMELLRAA